MYNVITINYETRITFSRNGILKLAHEYLFVKKARTLNIGSFDAAKAKEKYQEVMPICKKEKCRGYGYTSDRSAHAPQEGEALSCDWRC